MKILVLTIFPPEIGGPATQAAHLCQALKDRGHVPVVVTLDKTKTFVDDYKGIRIHRLCLTSPKDNAPHARVLKFVRFAYHVYHILKSELPDIVHCNALDFYGLLASVLCSMRRIPTVVKFASDMVWELLNRERLVVNTIEEAHRFSRKARFLLTLERFTLQRFSLVWAASQYRKKTLVELLGLDEKRVRVIPNYVQLPRRLEAGFSRYHEQVYLIAGGRFVPHKRLEDCITALSRIARGDVILRLYGGGNKRQETIIASAISDLNLQERVEWYGELPYHELIELLCSSHVYISTSIEEGFPISLIEAMAVGLPIVAARKGAVPELVPEGQAGLLYEAGNIDELVKALERLIGDAPLRERLGDFGAAHAAKFDLSIGIEHYCQLYEELVAGRG